MRTQAQAAAAALAPTPINTSALQSAYDALKNDAASAQPLLSSLSGTDQNSVAIALQDVTTQLATLYAVAYPPFGSANTWQATSTVTAQNAAAVAATQAVSRDALLISNTVSALLPPPPTPEQLAAMAAAYQSQTQTVPTQFSSPPPSPSPAPSPAVLPPVPAGPISTSSVSTSTPSTAVPAGPISTSSVSTSTPSTVGTTALVVGGVALAGGVAWWYFL